MAINILQELNLGAAKASFSRDEVETLAEIKNLNVAQKYPNNYDIFCKEDGCKYRLNKTSHSTMQDNLPHPTGKWRRIDSVISSSMPAPITVGDVILYLGPTVVDRTDPLNPVVKYQTGKYYRTEYTKVSKQMYAFVQNTAPDVPDTSPTPAVIWFSETSTLSEGSVLFTPVDGSIFDNKEHGIIMTSDWDGESAISGSSYEYLDNSNSAKLGMVRNSDFDTTFDSYPELTWNMFDTEAELENIKQNVIPEAISSVTDDISAIETKVTKSSKLADRFTDAEMDKLFKKISEKIISSVNGVNDVDFRICACASSDNWATATITKYMEAPLSGDLTDYHIALPGAYGNTFDTIAVSCGISFSNGTSATGTPLYAVSDGKAINTWLDASLLNPVAIYTAQTSSSSSFDNSTYYRTRVKDGGPSGSTIKYSDMEPLKSNAYESPSRIHFLVFIQVNNNTTAEDLNAADLFELAKKAIVPVGVTSGMLMEFDSVKENASSAVTDIESLSATVDTRIPSKTSDFIKDNIFEDKTPVHMIASYSASYHGPGTYDNTNNNGLISIGSTYDHTDANRSITPVFKNYFDPDSASADYVEASEVLAIKESEVWSNKASYIAIPVYIGSATTKALLAESLTSVIGSFNPSYNYKMTLNGRSVNTYGTLVDIYAGIGSSDKIDSIGNVKSWTRLTENSFSASELVASLPDIVYGTYRRLTLVLVYKVYYGDYPVFDSADIIRIDSDTLIANTLNIAKNSLDERLSDIEEATGDVSDLIERTSAIETKLEPLTDETIAKIGTIKTVSEGVSFEYRYYEPDPEHPEDLLIPVSAKTKEQQIEEKEITIGFGAEFEEQTDSDETETITVYGGYLSGTAGKSQIDLIAKTMPIIDADESEKSANTLNSMLYSSSEGIKCVTVPLQLVHANGNFLIDATNMDELLEFKITSEFGDHECGNINFSLEDVFVGISMGNTEPEDSSRSLEESQLFTIKNSSSSFTFIRVGKRDYDADSSEALNNTVTADLSESQYLGGLVEELKPYMQYMEGMSFNIIILAGIHVETERDTVFPLKDFVDAGEDIIDTLNESISFYKLKGDIISSFENDIEDIKDDLSVVSDLSKNLSKNFEGDKKTLWDSISTGSLTAYDFNARSNLKNMASANHKYRVGLIAPNWMESWNYNAFVNIGSSYTVGDNRIYPQYMNYFNEEEVSTYGEFHDIKDVFVNVEGYSAYMLHTGLYLQSDLFYDSGDYYIGGSMTNQFDLLEAMMYSMPHIDFSKYTEGDRSRQDIYQTDEAKTKILCGVLVEDVYIAAITSTDPSDVSKFVWKKYTGPQSIIDCFEQYLGVNSKMDSVGQVRLGIIVSLRCRTNNISSAEIEECLETFRTADTQEFIERNLSFSDNRISKAVDAYNMAKTAKDTPDLMYYPSIVACRTRITGGTIASEGIDFGSFYTPRIVSPIVDNEDGTYTLKYWNNANSEAFDQTKVADIINSGTMWYTAGFFGENLSVALDSLSVSDDILSNFVDTFTGLAWYDADTYMKSLDTALKPKYTMRNIEPRLDNESIKNRDNIDISELFLNIDTRLVKEIYVAVVSEGNNMGYPSLGTYYTTSVESGGSHEYIIERLETIPVFRKLEINTVNDIYTISMQRIVDLCGRPGFSNNVSETNKGAHILFTIKVDTSAIPFFKTPELVTYLFGNDTVASLYDTSANSTSKIGNDSSITGNRLQIFNALFNNIKRYPNRCPGLWHAVYITGSVDQSIRETKNVVFDNIKNKTSKIAKYCSSDNDLNYLETGGIGYRARKDTEDNSKYLADVYMKTEDGSVIKIAEGRQITTPSPELIRILSNT